jgi:NADPH:quinone reductase-like Zn-dependent oxidoreductase
MNDIMPPTTATMQAAQYMTAKDGLERNLYLSNIPIPSVPLSVTSDSARCILVQVTHVSLNPADHTLPEDPLLGRLTIWYRPATPCFDFAGRIIELPKHMTTSARANIKDLKIGDAVLGRFGYPYTLGALAEYTLAQPNGLAKLPGNVPAAHGAALGTAAITAYQALVPYIKKGDRVFVNGGSGGVGTFVIQMAKVLGASHVTASCSGTNVSMVTNLGADEVINYRDVNLTEHLKTMAMSSGDRPLFDHMVDCVAEVSTLYENSHYYLNPAGIFIQVAGTMDSLAGVWSMASRIFRPSWLGGGQRRWKVLLAYQDSVALHKIAQWAAEGRLKPVIDSEYELADAALAFSKLKTGRARGKILISVSK